MPSKDPSQGGQEEHDGTGVRRSTLFLTNCGKVAALYLVVHEATAVPSPRMSLIAIAAMLLLGAQKFEDIILKAIDRFFGRDA